MESLSLLNCSRRWYCCERFTDLRLRAPIVLGGLSSDLTPNLLANVGRSVGRGVGGSVGGSVSMTADPHLTLISIL